MSNNNSSKERWYYDACALDEGKNTYAEIINKNFPKTALISYLSLGEAYGNCYKKSKTKAEALLELIEKLRNYIEIVDNDGIEDIFEEIQDEFDTNRLSITDSIHLATAIFHKCDILRTADRDLYGLDPRKILKLSENFDLKRFKITKIGIKR